MSKALRTANTMGSIIAEKLLFQKQRQFASMNNRKSKQQKTTLSS